MRFHAPDAAVDASSLEGPARAVSSRRLSTLRRRLLWTGVAALVISVATLAPPLINANRYRSQIAQTMSASLGRPVHLDNVSMHLLPVPGFTLQNFVVSEDPEFGSEPMIRADSVEATLRVSSLWHRPVEFSTVRFVNPSVNLVRNSAGRWNLSEVLLHASRVQSAPTDQRHAGPTPRFPYIEATSGRVNVKLGAEKLPFSLTDADFALWLPSSQQWRLRLIGHPARTDSNITDPGTIRIEGGLRRADAIAAVPVNFSASWHDAPLGEATRVLTGDDWGWRGTVNLDLTLAGTLGNAQMGSKLTLGGLRRAEFFPARPMDLQINCGSGFMLNPGTLLNLSCTLPDDAPKPLTLTADRVSLQNGRPQNPSLQGKDIPVRWALLWASLFSSRVPTDLHPAGTVDVDITRGLPSAAPAPAATRKHPVRRTPAANPVATEAGWVGTVQLTVPGGDDTGDTPASTASENVLTWHLQPSAAKGSLPQLHLEPTPVRLGPNAVVTVGGNLGETGYSLNVNGNAPAAALLEPARYLPQLADGLEQVLTSSPTGIQPARLEFSCTHPWDAAQTCTGPQALAPGRTTVSVPSVQPAHVPPALAPHSLSPYDYPAAGTPR